MLTLSHISILCIHHSCGLDKIQAGKESENASTLMHVQAKEYGLVDDVLGEAWPVELLDEGIFAKDVPM